MALSRMLVFALWLGCIVQAFLLGIWVFIGQANPAGQPPHLSASHALLVAGLVIMLVLYGVWFARSFSTAR